MSLITRREKGSKLTIDEVDGNFEYLKNASRPLFMDITNQVIDGVYIIQEDDYHQVLVYTGGGDINILLSTNIPYEVSDTLRIIQKGSGVINLVTDGFILGLINSELPSTSGINTYMHITVYSKNLPELLITGKLKKI